MSSENSRVEIIRPQMSHWPGIISVLRLANFQDIGGPEMAQFPVEDCFVALVDGSVLGVGGYRILNATEAKTTLLAVNPTAARHKLGARLQDARLNFLRQNGIRTVFTNTDDPRVIRWLERNYGFVQTGEKVQKVSDFGRSEIAAWTTMRLDFS